MRAALWLSLSVCTGMALLMWLADWWIDREAAPYVAETADAARNADVGLVLGTTPWIAEGRRNRFFEYRLDAAATLYKAGRVKYLLVSGDNRRRDYNEPAAMKDGLVARGVPANAIYRDFAGIRTLDSVLRAKAVFGQSKLVIVSQDFHVRRAVWLARRHGIEAFGLAATDVPPSEAPLTWLRHYASALVAVYDVWAGTTSRHGGAAIAIGRDPAN